MRASGDNISAAVAKTLSHLPTRSSTNEGRTLDAVLRSIEERDAVMREGTYEFPDKADRDGEAIDLVCRFNGRRVALEATFIETFPNQVRLWNRTRKFFEPVESQLNKVLSETDHFHLNVPFDCTKNMRRAKMVPIRDALVAWIRATGPRIVCAPYDSVRKSIVNVTPQGVPFAVSLHRWKAPEEMQGTFWVSPVFVENRKKTRLEEARLDRLLTCCKNKFPKLNAWKKREGARTVLVLEASDAWLTNPTLVAEALALAESRRNDRPDEVFLVCTHNKRNWWVNCLRRDENPRRNDEIQFWHFDPETLDDLTQR